MSWFLIGATIDISTILTTTVAALPSTFVAQNSDAKEKIIQSVKNTRQTATRKINLSSSCGDAKKSIETSNIDKNNNTKAPSDKEILDMILPKDDSITGPLMYIGIAVLQVQDFIYDDVDGLFKNNNTALFVIMTRLAITLVFVIIIIMLIVINVFRIVTIRFAVSFAPLLIVAMASGDNESRKDMDLLKNFSITNIIKSIFAPVIAVGLMSIGLIVIVIMQ